MMLAIPPVARIGPWIIFGLQPRLGMSGIRVVPSIAVLAMEKPGRRGKDRSAAERKTEQPAAGSAGAFVQCVEYPGRKTAVKQQLFHDREQRHGL
ncbi:hypothetical protein SAMN05877838_3904 [Hoeflea halophila]|uniref:Uncharacterized protein n=1 Tax=Hoeflea halophila TaxID=714899 RepID=A0A286IFN2_9HYPH|nr:hypothetical protein [Hoeflea halophila]SOE18955.1 hypothetical protein SAMN05877838_3904 [Hoeflea halophila]